MASATLKLLMDLEDNVSNQIEKVKGNLGNFEKSVQKLEPTFKKMAAVGAVGFDAVATAVGLTVDAEAQQNRLVQILRTTTGATDEQVAALNRQAEALEQVGVISAGSITAAQSQLATFDLSVDTIQTLTPAILDYVVAERGATATTEDLKSMTTGLAQALQGNYGTLSKSGFILDDATKKIIENGTEAERAAAIVDVLNSTYKGFNESARNTAQGGMVALKNQFDQLKETIGQQFLPIIQKVVEVISPYVQKLQEWITANPELARNILIVVAAIAGLLAVIGTIGLALAPIIAGFSALAAVIGFLVSPIGLVLLAIAALIAAGVLLYRHWDEVSSWASNIWNKIKETIANAMQAVAQVLSTIWEGIKSVFQTAVYFIVELWATMLDFLFPGWQTALQNCYNTLVAIWTSISGFVKVVWTEFTKFWGDKLGELSGKWSEIWTGMKDALGTIFDSVKEIAGAVFDWIKSGIDTLMAPLQKLIDLAQKAFDMAKNAVSSLGGSIKSAASSVVEKGKSVLGRATGGPVMGGTSYLVGEHGPELFTPAYSGRIGQLAGAGGGNTIINLTMTGNTLLDREAAKKVGKELVTYLKDNLRL